RIELGPLDHRATIALAEQYAGGALDPESGNVVATFTDGNPLFVRELILAARESDTLVPSPAGVRIVAIPASAGRLRDLMAHRIAGLSADAQAALLRVAAAEPLGPGELPAGVSPGTLAGLDRGGHL